jgi:hypothetical protein
MEAEFGGEKAVSEEFGTEGNGENEGWQAGMTEAALPKVPSEFF